MPVLKPKSTTVEFARQATGTTDGKPYWDSVCGLYKMIRYSGKEWRVYDSEGNSASNGYCSSRLFAERAVTEYHKRLLRADLKVEFVDKSMVSECGGYKLTYDKQNGWRAYRKVEADAWAVLIPGVNYDSRAEAIECINSYFRTRKG